MKGYKMKIRFYCDSGANVHSCNEEIIDLAEYFDCSEKEARLSWKVMSDDDKYKEAKQWAWNSGLDIGYEVIND